MGEGRLFFFSLGESRDRAWLAKTESCQSSCENESEGEWGWALVCSPQQEIRRDGVRIGHSSQLALGSGQAWGGASI